MFTPGGLIFDCDGTLADTMPAHFEAWTAVLQRYGLAFSEERFYQLGGVPSHRIAALLAQEQGVPIDADRVARVKEAAFLEHLPAVRPVPAVVAVARSHRGRVPMAVASGGFRPVIAGLPIWMDDRARITHEWVTHIRPKFCAGHRLAQGFDR